MALINNIQADILESLGRFSYLSVSQFQRLTGKSLGYLREQLAILSERKLIKSYHVEITARVRAENIYYLLPAGKEVLQHNEKAFADDIRVPAGVPLVVRDYQHRKNFVDLHIALYKQLQKQGIPLSLFLSYYDKVGNNRKEGNLESKTKIPCGKEAFFIPDGVMITGRGESKTLYLLEMYNGKDTIRTLQQLGKHAEAIAQGSPGQAFGIRANPLVLSAFEYDSIKQAVIKRLQQNERFSAMSSLYFFASLEEIKTNCEGAWETIDSETLLFR